MATRYTLGRQLYDAAGQGDITGMKTALSNGADINYKNPDWSNETPLHAAAWNNKFDAVQFLLDRAADVDSRDIYGYSPLILAALNGHTQIAKVLLDNGADIAASDNRGKTALDYAEQRGDTDTATLLRVHSDNSSKYEGERNLLYKKR